MEVEWQTAGLPALKSGFGSRDPLRRPARGHASAGTGATMPNEKCAEWDEAVRAAAATRRRGRDPERAPGSSYDEAPLFKARPGFAPGWTAMQAVAYFLGHRA